jgi:hypothetical protein
VSAQQPSDGGFDGDCAVHGLGAGEVLLLDLGVHGADRGSALVADADCGDLCTDAVAVETVHLLASTAGAVRAANLLRQASDT